MNTDEKLLAYLTAKSAYQSKAISKEQGFTFISKITGIPQIWTLNGRGEPVQFAELEDRVLSVFHSPNGKQTAVGMDHHGNEKQQLYLIEEQGKEVSSLINEPDYFHHIGGWSPNGEKIVFSSNRRHPGYFDLFTVDVVSKQVMKHFEYDGNLVPIGWLPNGESILIKIRETNIDSSIYIYHIASGNKVKIGKDQVLGRYDGIKVTKNEEKAYLLTDVEEETVYIGVVDLKEPENIEKIVHVEGWDIEEISLSPNEEKLVYTLNEGGIFKLYSLDCPTGIKENLEIASKGVIDSISWLDDETFIFTMISPVSPGDTWKYSFATNQFERLTYISQSEVEKDWIEPDICTFKSFDELEVPYFFYEKEKTPNRPVVIYVHGGPEGQTRAEYNPVIQFLADQGFAVAAPNVRGSSGYGRTYIKLDDVRKRMDSVADLAWLVKDLISTHQVDPKKIGVMGRSYGGFMVLAALTHYPDLWAAGVDIVGISHFKTFLENTGSWRRRLRACEYGTLEDDTDFFEEIAPLNHSERIQAPLIVFHGRNDTRVPVSEAEQLVADMQSRGQTVEFTVFEDEGHQTERIENHITMNSEIVQFLKKYL